MVILLVVSTDAFSFSMTEKRINLKENSDDLGSFNSHCGIKNAYHGYFNANLYKLWPSQHVNKAYTILPLTPHNLQTPKLTSKYT